MITLCKTYPDGGTARAVADALVRAGVPERDVQVIAHSGWHDVRQEPVGQFAGPVAPDAPVGTYGGRRRLRRQGAGSFAGNPDLQRQGSFGDVDREVLITHDGGGEHGRIVSQRALRQLLGQLAVTEPEQARIQSDRGGGCATVLVELAELPADGAMARLESFPHAA
jgi:hypothetical protein